MDRAIAMHIANLIGRLIHLEDLARQHGPNMGRDREHDAIEWTLHDLGERYPAEVAEAEIIAEDRQRRRAERAQYGR